uniref:COMM domain-containing protein n=1 Tax=Acrobeloides nanus TaxID=290746 RepID=A0A914D9K9_9BILA
LDFNDETVTTFLDVWQELGPSVSNRLRNVSRSGVPELLSVDWYLQLERANRFEAAKREPKVQLKLTTDQGEKYEEMSFEQLKALNYTLHEIQDKVDSLMQS